tara:strand:+ start:438 stop:569 length:132 start_codon:yes stop_codon:yes gene_type:complete
MLENPELNDVPKGFVVALLTLAYAIISKVGVGAGTTTEVIPVT